MCRYRKETTVGNLDYPIAAGRLLSLPVRISQFGGLMECADSVAAGGHHV